VISSTYIASLFTFTCNNCANFLYKRVDANGNDVASNFDAFPFSEDGSISVSVQTEVEAELYIKVYFAY